MRIKSSLKSNNQLGASAVEYALGLAIITTMVMAGAQLMNVSLEATFKNVGDCAKTFFLDCGDGRSNKTSNSPPENEVAHVWKWVYEGGKWVLKKIKPKPKIKLKKIPKPNVNDPKLKNITDDLYKGANTKKPIGSGSTADAIRYEKATGKPVGGKFHTEKGRQYARALEKWLEKNPNASSSDRNAAKIMLDDLNDALGGVSSG